MPQARYPARGSERGGVPFYSLPQAGRHLLGEDVEPDLDLGAVGAGHVALRGRDPHGLARARLLPTVGEIDGDGEDVAVASELDVFHCLSPVGWRLPRFPFLRCGEWEPVLLHLLPGS